MSTIIANNKDLIHDYFDVLCRSPKTEELIDRYVDDPSLKQEILRAEAAFSGYQLVIEQMLAEDDLVAVRATMNGTHRGQFAGVPPTGRAVSVGCMVFYRIAEGRIVQFWMQLDSLSLMSQLTT